MRISIEGNIGVGKSTLLQKLSEDTHFKCVPEPIDLWKNLNGYNVLELFYNDSKKYSTTFQFYSMLTIFKDRCKTYTEKHVVFERSLQTGINVFSKNLLNNNFMSNVDYLVLKEYFLELEILASPVSLFGKKTLYIFLFLYI